VQTVSTHLAKTNLGVLTPQRGSFTTIVVTLAKNLLVLVMAMSSSGMAQHAGMNEGRTSSSTDQEHLVAASVQSSREVEFSLVSRMCSRRGWL
jgi:hypothetical protein